MPSGSLQDPHLSGQIITVPVRSTLFSPQLSSLSSLESQRSTVIRGGVERPDEGPERKLTLA